MLASLASVFVPRWPRLLAATLLASVAGAALYGVRVLHVGTDYAWYAREGVVMPELDGFRDPLLTFLAPTARSLNGQDFGDALVTSIYFVDLFSIGFLFLSVFDGRFRTFTRVALLTLCVLVLSLTTLIPPPPYATSTYATAMSATTLVDPSSAIRALAVADVCQRTSDTVRRVVPVVLVAIADYFALFLGTQYTFAVVSGTILALLVHFAVREAVPPPLPHKVVLSPAPPPSVKPPPEPELEEPSMVEPSTHGVYGVADALEEEEKEEDDGPP